MVTGAQGHRSKITGAAVTQSLRNNITCNSPIRAQKLEPSSKESVYHLCCVVVLCRWQEEVSSAAWLASGQPQTTDTLSFPVLLAVLVVCQGRLWVTGASGKFMTWPTYGIVIVTLVVLTPGRMCLPATTIARGEQCGSLIHFSSMCKGHAWPTQPTERTAAQ